MDRPFRKVYQLEAQPEVVWDAFLQENILEEWLASESEMDDREGFKFYWKVAGERMDGKVVELDVHERIIFEWKREEWPDEQFATVNIQLNEMSNGTRLEINITDIPDTEYDEVYDDWDGEIMPRLMKYLKDLQK